MSTNGRLIRDGNGIPLGCSFYVRVPRSRRKLERLIAALGGKPQFYYSFRFSGNFIYVTDEQYEQVKLLVTKARVDTDKLLKCWS